MHRSCDSVLKSDKYWKVFHPFHVKGTSMQDLRDLEVIAGLVGLKPRKSRNYLEVPQVP